MSTMSDKQPSAAQQGKRRKGGGGRESFRGGDRVKVHLHAVTDEQAALLTVNARPLEEVKKKTGADVHFDPNPSPVPGMKILIIRGVPSQIEVVFRLIRLMTGSQATLAEEVQTFWLQWVEAAYPDLESRAYFLPPVYFNRVPMTRATFAGQDVQVLLPQKGGRLKRLVERFESLLTSVKTNEERHEDGSHSNHRVKSPPEAAVAFISQLGAVQDSDIRYDAAMRQVLFCLQKLSRKTREVLVGITRLHFGQYLSEPCFAVAAAQLPRASSLSPNLPQSWKQGEFDVLLIHRHYGLVVCNVISFGDITNDLKMSQQDIDNNIRKKLRDAVSQLNKAEAMLSHLVSDIAPGLRITKTIAFPNLTADQVQQAIFHDSQLTEDLHCCLKTTDPADIADVCLCCDQLSDPKTPCDVSSHVLKKLGKWWTRRVAVSGRDSHMTRHVYRTLVARFCGPATTVSVPCTCPPRCTQCNACSYILCYRIKNFQTLCDKLLTQVPRLHLWAASCFHEHAPAGWQVENFTRPLRSPPAVIREVEREVYVSGCRDILPYRERGVPDHTEGPPVRRLYHRGQGHSGRLPGDCVTCGREVASFLHSLRVGVTESGTTTSTTLTSTSGGTPPCLQWRDVLVLYWYDVSDQSGVVTGLQEAGIPVRMMKDDDIEDVATARSDVVWVTNGHRVRGLERKIVVCLEDPDYYSYTFEVLQRYIPCSARVDYISRCTSQLVIVYSH
ncbi:uncharacterized protein LOC112574719 [Pomacea canaliculata]|uniref:uncharacterized protein LOC112574719 n=1 Tax=Pomacea canaliculata TaxID=400727 RepID=UPI000D73C5A3|nr:uncharacterized protein LOC112574719 [Pomacea canaliculata]